MYTTSPHLGRKACLVRISIYLSRSILPDAENAHHSPGRFFGYIGVKVDFRLPHRLKWQDSVFSESVPGYTAEDYRPPDLCYGHRMMPDRTPVMLIKRVDV